MDRALVVIPTYNEKDNIKDLIDSLISLSENLDILVVDDSSPDGTGSRVKSHQFFNSRVFILERKGKAGRGSACIDGFKYAFDREQYEYVIEMDSDFSHDPRDIPKLLNKAKSCDIVIGSRYIKGGKIIGWNLRRRVLSKFANLYARLVLGIPISDYTNGYRVYRKSELKKLAFDKFKSKGYITLSEIAYNMYRNRARFGEVPITFVNRRRGTSNLSLAEVKEAFLTVLRLRGG